MSSATDWFWDWLRLSRSDPPGLAGDDEERARLYRAALQQFEDLMRAAGSTGVSARPLPLFYALSQASQAIIAAYGSPGSGTHGLSCRDPMEPLLETPVRPHKDIGDFQILADAVDSPALAESVELGALLCALPELGVDALLNDRWLRCLPVWPEHQDPRMRGPWIRTGVEFPEWPNDGDEVKRVLSSYSVRQGGWRDVGSEYGLGQPSSIYTVSGRAVGIDFLTSKGDLDEVIPPYRWLERRWLRPLLVGKEPPSPLVTWWALLLGLSSLARYHPVPWSQALDPDSSPLAAPLERVMREAMDALPQLVTEAVFQRRLLVPPPVLM